MRFEHRPYSGKTYRPKPEIYLDQEFKSLIVATPWGARASAKRAIDSILEYFLVARQDHEVTSPFERLSCLSKTANVLRIAAMLANEALFREENTEEFRSGVELFCATSSENELTWIQVGHPQVFLNRKGRPLAPLGTCLDLSYDLTDGPELLAPLPSQLLGLDSSVNLTINSFRIQKGDQIVLLSHPIIPEEVFQRQKSSLTLDDLSRLLAARQPDHGFWLGILDLADEVKS